MPDARLRFQVLVNGEQQCVAGVGEYGVMTAVVCWVRKRERQPDETQTNPGNVPREEFHLSIGGLGSNIAMNKHVDWPTCSLKSGDEVTFKILGAGECDPPCGPGPESNRV